MKSFTALVSIAASQFLLASGTRSDRILHAATGHLADEADGRQVQESATGHWKNLMVDIDSEMSTLLADIGAIREDTYNKPGKKYTLKVDSGKFQSNPFISGTFRAGGAYGGLIAGATLGVLPAVAPLVVLPVLAAGAVGGWTAGDRAAEMLTRILQGDADADLTRRSIGISETWEDEQTQKSIAAQIMSPAADTASTLTSQVPAVQKETTFLASIQTVLGMGNRSSSLVNSIISDTRHTVNPHQVVNSTISGLALDAINPRPYFLMETTDKKVISGLNQALRSHDPQEVEDAKITATVLEIVRHGQDGVEVVVE